MNNLEALFNVAERVESMDINSIMLMLSKDREFTDKIIELNTRGQLFDKGINSKGILLSQIGGDYSEKTISKAKEKGKPKISPSHINLNDTDYFYKSFRVYIDLNHDLNIYADPFKTDWAGTINLLSEWGEDVLGLTDESLSILIDMAKEKCLNIVRLKLAA